MVMLLSESGRWLTGLVLGVVVIAVAAVIVITIVLLANRIARQAKTAEGAVEVVRAADGRARAASAGSTTPACASCTPPGRCERWRSANDACSRSPHTPTG